MTPRYERHPDLRLTALDGEGVVLHLGTRRYFTVNETGIAVLNALVEPRGWDDLIAGLRDEYELQPGDEATVRDFLDRCLGADVVRVTREPTAEPAA